jgi:hypothetical protein
MKENLYLNINKVNNFVNVKEEIARACQRFAYIMSTDSLLLGANLASCYVQCYV